MDFLRMRNPAADVLHRYDVDKSHDFNQHFPDELIDQFERAMREAIGPSHIRFTRDEVLDALTNPSQPLIGYADSLPRLRARLSPATSECCSDDDLLRAARCLDEPLIASAACRIQVRAKDLSKAEPLCFTPKELGRRVEADLNVANYRRKVERVVP
jgi:hypothetical protein